MTVATLVLSLSCLVVLLITGMLADTDTPEGVDTLGMVVTFLVMPILLSIAILNIIQVAS